MRPRVPREAGGQRHARVGQFGRADPSPSGRLPSATWARLHVPTCWNSMERSGARHLLGGQLRCRAGGYGRTQPRMGKTATLQSNRRVVHHASGSTMHACVHEYYSSMASMPCLVVRWHRRTVEMELVISLLRIVVLEFTEVAPLRTF